MSRFYSHINTAVKLIGSYKAGSPLHLQLKDFFAKEKKYGSKDRKMIARLCYAYFRVAAGFKNKATIEKIIANALFLISTDPDPYLELLEPELNAQVTLPFNQKLELSGIELNELFPLYHELGKDVEPSAYIASLLKQPDVFIRIRPGKASAVENQLAENQVQFKKESPNCIRLSSGTSVEKLLKLNKEAVIQDLNSQKVFNYLSEHLELVSSEEPLTCWDACAASGGKSILLQDVVQRKMRLTVSDIRNNMLSNLELRLKEAGINIFRKFAADLSKGSNLSSDEKFAVIIADVPCTGSGTWARTPEQMFGFEQTQIKDFATLQQNIVSGILPHLKKGGLFIYITCSVFRQENEDQLAFIQQTGNFKLAHAEYLQGYESAADTMYVALFTC